MPWASSSWGPAPRRPFAVPAPGLRLSLSPPAQRSAVWADRPTHHSHAEHGWLSPLVQVVVSVPAIEVEITEIAEADGVRVWEVATPDGTVVGYDFQAVGDE